MPLLLIAVASVIVLALWYAHRRTVVVPCTISLEATHDQFAAHVELQGDVANEGDQVLVHEAPDRIAFGTQRTLQSSATVQHASLPRRILTRVLGTSHITELYEVGFEG